MSGFRVVICGGGIAGVEGLLRLHRLLGDAVEITLVAPDEELRYRPLAIQEPFGRSGARRYRLAPIALHAGAELVQDALEWVDPDGQVVHAASGRSLPYDALLVATGARSAPAFEHATTFDDAHADETFLGIVQDLEEGYSTQLALLVPDGPSWPLPIYELALQTADRVRGMGLDAAEITVVTPERTPLEVFGEPVSRATAGLLADAGVRVRAETRAEVPANRELIAQPGNERLPVERIVALPRIVGPAVRGLPSEDGFIPIDDRCRVRGLGEHVFAAGDATDFPVKQGGLGTQQADVAAANIAALAGDGEPAALAPVLRGSLIAGERARLFMQARLEDGRPVDSQVVDEPDWSADEKVVAAELGPYLHALDRGA